jgi:hypothetical protein
MASAVFVLLGFAVLVAPCVLLLRWTDRRHKRMYPGGKVPASVRSEQDHPYRGEEKAARYGPDGGGAGL